MSDRLIVGIEFCCIHEKKLHLFNQWDLLLPLLTVDSKSVSVSLVYSTSLLSPLQDLFIRLYTQGLYFQMGNFFQ